MKWLLGIIGALAALWLVLRRRAPGSSAPTRAPRSVGPSASLLAGIKGPGSFEATVQDFCGYITDPTMREACRRADRGDSPQSVGSWLAEQGATALCAGAGPLAGYCGDLAEATVGNLLEPYKRTPEQFADWLYYEGRSGDAFLNADANKYVRALGFDGQKMYRQSAANTPARLRGQFGATFDGKSKEKSRPVVAAAIRTYTGTDAALLAVKARGGSSLNG